MNTRIPALVASALLVAVTGGAVTAQSSPAPEGTKLKVWARNYSIAQDSPFITAQKTFEAAHPGVTIDLTGANYDQQLDRIRLSQAGQIEDTPDVFQIDNIWLGEMAESNGGPAANLDS
jgi:ABC-type glycerol-3-phosphate transport system substrate-binding protein